MKQMKFLLVALMTAVMWVSVTSCMNGEDNNIATGGIFVKNSFSSFEAADGMKIIPTSGMNTLLTGTYYYIYCQYDFSQLTENSTSLSVSLLADPICIDPKSGENPSPSDREATNPLYVLNEDLKSGMLFWDENTLIMPVTFYCKNELTTEELEKHWFYITYDPNAIEEDDTKLTLTINHVLNKGDEGENEVERKNKTSLYKAYTLSGALSEFLNKTHGKKPTHIVLRAYTNSSEDKLKEDDTYTTLELEYPYKE